MLDGFVSPEVILNALFGGTWEDVKTWDDVVPIERRRFIPQLLAVYPLSARCGYLRLENTCFVYCAAIESELEKSGLKITETPSPRSAKYHAQLDHFSMQLHCLVGSKNYKNCIEYQKAEEGVIDVHPKKIGD
ncbi:MAG: hypothetical protein ABIE22_05635 [archaeon]